MIDDERKPRYRLVLFLSAIALVLFFLWAANSDIDQQVRGAGRVIPASENKTVQHLEGGIISEILVREGQNVEPGDTMFIIRNQDADSDLQEIQIKILATQIELERLSAEYNGKEFFEISDDMLKRAPQISANQQQLFQTRQAQFGQQISILEERKNQKTYKLDDLQTQLQNVLAEQKTAKNQLEINRRLKTSGAISESKYLESQSVVQSFNTRIAQLQKQIPIIKAELSEAVNEIREAKEGIKAKIGEELSDKNVQLQQLVERIKSSNDVVDRAAINSPIKGVVKKLYMNTIGGVVRPGAPLAEIIPLDDSLIVEAKISTDDRGKIWPGLPVQVKITAYDFTVFGGVEGELISISPDSFKEENGHEYYQVKVSLENTYVAKDKPVFPGMTAQISIMTGKRKIIDYILKPFRQIEANAFRE